MVRPAIPGGSSNKAPAPAPPRTVKYRNDLGPGGAGNTNSTGHATAAGAAAYAAAHRHVAAAAKPAPGLLINPPLHPLSESPFMFGRDAVALQRGLIRRVSAVAGNDAAQPMTASDRYQFRFLYNPESLEFSNSTFTGLVDPLYAGSADYPHMRFPGQETVTFALMLDRTQDAYAQGLTTLGTQVDIDALYRVINGSEVNPGYLYLSAVEIFWGPASANGGYTQNGRPLPPFPCYITNLQISHTQFTPRMCPIRTIVTISANSLVGATSKADPARSSISPAVGS
jgi:hypothetical protein